MPHQLPDREPDLICDIDIRPEQALLYRLFGDRNPLHADPAAARGAGFDAPVYPGDVLTTDMWQDRNVISFRCYVKGKEPMVLDNGKCTLAAWMVRADAR